MYVPDIHHRHDVCVGTNALWMRYECVMNASCQVHTSWVLSHSHCTNAYERMRYECVPTLIPRIHTTHWFPIHDTVIPHSWRIHPHTHPTQLRHIYSTHSFHMFIPRTHSTNSFHTLIPHIYSTRSFHMFIPHSRHVHSTHSFPIHNTFVSHS